MVSQAEPDRKHRAGQGGRCLPARDDATATATTTATHADASATHNEQRDLATTATTTTTKARMHGAHNDCGNHVCGGDTGDAEEQGDCQTDGHKEKLRRARVGNMSKPQTRRRTQRYVENGRRCKEEKHTCTNNQSRMRMSRVANKSGKRNENDECKQVRKTNHPEQTKMSQATRAHTATPTQLSLGQQRIRRGMEQGHRQLRINECNAGNQCRFGEQPCNDNNDGSRGDGPNGSD